MTRHETDENKSFTRRSFILLGTGLIFLSILSGILGLIQGPVRSFAGVEPHFVLFFLPLVMLLVFVGTSLLMDKKDQYAQTMVVWLLSFLYSLHMLLVLVALGVLNDLIMGIPIVAALMFFALGQIVAKTPYRSAMGLRTSVTLATSSHWIRVHSRFGLGLRVTAGVVLAFTFATFPRLALLSIAIGPVLAMIMALIWVRT